MGETLTCKHVYDTLPFQWLAVLPVSMGHGRFRYQAVANLMYYNTVFIW